MCYSVGRVCDVLSNAHPCELPALTPSISKGKRSTPGSDFEIYFQRTHHCQVGRRYDFLVKEKGGSRLKTQELKVDRTRKRPGHSQKCTIKSSGVQASRVFKQCAKRVGLLASAHLLTATMGHKRKIRSARTPEM